ncbi:ABC transporter ATP-binding protein [Methanocella arvoryzae]|uniref:ABC-type transport system, ATPase component n=1 Tax=Methanocella arvoryzae (strain DSM 22066 / NBRC 105507 / MRE50) TaxID=351160 RepID=Q0W6C9_METAR|nr:phosphate ABC transporter ATP-binding protein [Methanocella arvoryzae]CAJ36064.1 ABC-type transport system, ATPase component [Methanocella arvoryzae MRE50]
MSGLSVRNVTKKVGNKAILKDVSLEVGDGEIMAILGPSGAGKSTLLRIINMLDRPDSGRVLLDGRDIWSGNRLEMQRSMAMVFQKPVAFSWNVYDNVAYGLRLRGVDKAEIDSRIKEALALLDMTGKERQYARSLSGGEAQRLAFARAFVLRPKLLLLDEPTANLDPANVAIMERAIKDINQKYRTTVVLVTHSIYQARRLSTMAAFMMNGEVVESGKDLIGNPSDPRTRMFINGELVY